MDRPTCRRQRDDEERDGREREASSHAGTIAPEVNGLTRVARVGAAPRGSVLQGKRRTWGSTKAPR